MFRFSVFSACIVTIYYQCMWKPTSQKGGLVCGRWWRLFLRNSTVLLSIRRFVMPSNPGKAEFGKSSKARELREASVISEADNKSWSNLSSSGKEDVRKMLELRGKTMRNLGVQQWSNERTLSLEGLVDKTPLCAVTSNAIVGRSGKAGYIYDHGVQLYKWWKRSSSSHGIPSRANTKIKWSRVSRWSVNGPPLNSPEGRRTGKRCIAWVSAFLPCTKMIIKDGENVLIKQSQIVSSQS